MNNSKIVWITAAAVLLGIGSFLIARSNYLLFHSFADMVTVFIAASVFVVAWNGRQRLDNHYFLVVGIGFLSFAFVDFLHLLGNKNMGVFTGYGNLGPPFYIASRYLLAFSLLIAPLFIRRKLNTPVALGVYSAVAAAVVLSILVWRNFPTTFIDGVGLTPFKVISDYIVCGILAAAIGIHVRNRQWFEPRVLKLLVASLVLSVATGLAFTLYTDPFGITNMVGHFFQIGSFALVYFAFVETALTKPQDILYRSLKQSKEKVIALNQELNELNATLEERIARRTEELETAHNDLLSQLRLRAKAEESLRSLSARLLNVQEEERRLIARELHDQIGQSLTVLKMMVGRAMREAPETTKIVLHSVSETITETLQQVRSLSLSLRPGVLDTLGLVPALELLFNDLKTKAGIDVHFGCSIDLTLPQTVAIGIYRITQEAITNIMRHAGVKEAWVKLEQQDGELNLTIEDHGCGFDVNVKGTSTGLSAMRERATLLGGVCLAESAVGGGTLIKVSLPLSLTQTMVT